MVSHHSEMLSEGNGYKLVKAHSMFKFCYQNPCFFRFILAKHFLQTNTKFLQILVLTFEHDINYNTMLVCSVYAIFFESHFPP